jgi:hypothetical protein
MRVKEKDGLKYKVDINQDVDQGCEGDYLLWLPFGYRFSDDLVHVRGYDSIAEIRKASKTDVIECNCPDCIRGIAVVKEMKEKLTKSN